jgi:hypothetical protein
MRRITPLLPFLVLIPTLAFALDFSQTTQFTDVRSSMPESTGISLLTHEGIVQGYSQNRFLPSRRINRAEFLKIAMKSAEENGTTMESKTCFLDVRAEDWFSPYVCAAKERGIVSGRTPTNFVPADAVSYGEALKMLTLLYGYQIPVSSNADWAEPYYEAAADREVDIPITIRLDRPLTRGLASRLTAAFLAESKGELMTFRLAESGVYSSVSSSVTSSSSSSALSSSSSSSSFSLSSSSSPHAIFTLPPVSHFLIVGKTSDAIASANVLSSGEPAHITSVKVKFYAEARTLVNLELVTITGSHVATLLRRTTADPVDYKQIYEVQLNMDQWYAIPADTTVPLVLRAIVRGTNDNGFSDELLEVNSFTITLHGDVSFNTQTVVAVAPFPKQQTAFGSVVSVTRTSPASGPLVAGTGIVVGAYSFSGSAIEGKSVSLEQLTFTVQRYGTVSTANWSIGQQGSSITSPCTIAEDGTVTCARLTDIFGSISGSAPLILELRADILAPIDPNATLQAVLQDPGSPSSLGSVQWTDGSGHFRWIEGTSPIARGTLLRGEQVLP